MSTKVFERFLTILLVNIMMTGFVHAKDDHRHHTSHKQGGEPGNKQNLKFYADKDLKERMDKILNLVIELKRQKINPKVISKYGESITQVVNDIFKTCKLEPSADEALHPILGAILDGAEDFKKGNFEIGHRKIHEAFLDYQQTFSKK